MSGAKQLTCHICDRAGFRNLAGLAGHVQLVHGLRPGRDIGGVQAEELVKAQQQLAERLAKLEASVSEVAKQLPEQVVKAQQQLAERLAKLEASVSEVAKQLPEQLVKAQQQLVERLAKLEASLSGLAKQLPERLDKALVAHRVALGEQHEEVLEELDGLERKLMPVQHLRAG